MTRAADRTLIAADDPAVARRELDRRRPGASTVSAQLTAAPMSFDLAGQTVSTWAFGAIPGTAIRARSGDIVEVVVRNNLPEDLTIHWHGIALRNDMDGVHDLTQPPIKPGSRFTYRFTAPDPGTHWFHPHTGLQLDRDLYAPLIIEDPAEPLTFDRDETLVLDDWLDGLGHTPEDALAEARERMGNMGSTDTMDVGGIGSMDMGGGSTDGMSMSTLLGGDAGDGRRLPEFLVDHSNGGMVGIASSCEWVGAGSAAMLGGCRGIRVADCGRLRSVCCVSAFGRDFVIGVVGGAAVSAVSAVSAVT